MSDPAIVTRLVEANGLNFEVDECGEGDRLALLLHGFPESKYSWRFQIPLLARLGYRVWAPNLRGYGKSSKPQAIADYHIDRLTDDVAGLIDAIAGGGGLLTVPALLTAGLPPHLVFGTNKGAAVFGSGAAFWRFARAGLIDGPRARWLFPLGFVGSLLGARLVLLLEPKVLKPLVLVLLVVAGVVVAFVRPPAEGASRPPLTHALFKAGGLALVIGAYDGFFGPGTGTFLIITFVTVLHLSLQQATANAKVVNFASNLAAMLLFVSQGLVVWKVSLPMAVGQFVGGTLGAQLAVKGGDRLVRRVVLGVVLALVARLGYDVVS
jgi:uncharacterized membrane protein YfcA